MSSLLCLSRIFSRWNATISIRSSSIDLDEYEYGSVVVLSADHSEDFSSVTKPIQKGSASLRSTGISSFSTRSKPVVPERVSSLYECCRPANNNGPIYQTFRPLRRGLTQSTVSVPNLSVMTTNARHNSNLSSNEANEDFLLSTEQTITESGSIWLLDSRSVQRTCPYSRLRQHRGITRRIYRNQLKSTEGRIIESRSLEHCTPIEIHLPQSFSRMIYGPFHGSFSTAITNWTHFGNERSFTSSRATCRQSCFVWLSKTNWTGQITVEKDQYGDRYRSKRKSTYSIDHSTAIIAQYSPSSNETNHYRSTIGCQFFLSDCSTCSSIERPSSREDNWIRISIQWFISFDQLLRQLCYEQWAELIKKWYNRRERNMTNRNYSRRSGLLEAMSSHMNK